MAKYLQKRASFAAKGKWWRRKGVELEMGREVALKILGAHPVQAYRSVQSCRSCRALKRVHSGVYRRWLRKQRRKKQVM
eukprot:COSAG02_NODE_9178_length_2300_cov_4.292140_3_plen_79_part_00